MVPKSVTADWLPLSNADVEPLAMVVIAFNTAITDVAMARFLGADDLTFGAKKVRVESLS